MNFISFALDASMDFVNLSVGSRTSRESNGTFTLHGNGNGTGTGNGTGQIGDNGFGPVPGPGTV